MAGVTTLALTFLSSFAFVATKAFQQRNVAFDNYVAVIPVSLLMALTEVYVMHNIAVQGYSAALVLSIGFGSGLGALAAMVLHKKMFKRKG